MPAPEPTAPNGGRYARLRLCPRAQGLCVDVNLNPDCGCNFDCIYCSVNRRRPEQDQSIDLAILHGELAQILKDLRQDNPSPSSEAFPRVLRHVAISGDGEPTLSPQFAKAVEAILHVRAVQQSFPFKLVLITNGTRLDQPEVQTGLRLFTAMDEIRVKLDAGSQECMSRIVRSSVIPLETVLNNILTIARRRPVMIQSLFPAMRSRGPDRIEIDCYVDRLLALVRQGAKIACVQIYSASPPVATQDCGHLPSRALSDIARQVRCVTGLKTEIC